MDTTSESVHPAFQAEDGTSTVRAVSKGCNAITVRHAYVQYRDVMKGFASGSAPTTTVVLKDFNMTVEKGHIYGLLGASGCGKTSILRAIIGQLDLAAGEIRVLGHKPKSPESGIPGTTIGYMPQELSLLGNFTIKETLYFYGQLTGMSSQEIDSQCDHLVKLLDLPKPSKTVGTLSGGQQRRVSFAIALMYSPPVLVLDEPTVGVDPLLRESIWNYLTDLVKTNGTTVLITTHYIEEANQADIVGLMRDGKLMAEQNPRSLIGSLLCKSLEDVLLKLCLKQSSEIDPMTSVEEHANLSAILSVNGEEARTETTTLWAKKSVSKIQRLRILAWKESVTILRHHWYMIFLFAVPILQCSLFCLTIGGFPRGLKISVFNEETNCFKGGTIVKSLQNNTVNCAQPGLLSCRILKSLEEKRISAIVSESEASAKNDVRRGLSSGVVTFQRNFTSALLERAGYLSPSEANGDVIDTGTIQVFMDQSERMLSLILQDELIKALKKAIKEVNDACHNLRHMTDLPIQFKTPVYGTFETNFQDFAAPGFVSGGIFILSITATINALLPEKLQGTLNRSLVVGVKMGEVIMSQFAVCLVPVFLLTTIVIVIPYLLFQLSMVGNFVTAIVLMLSLATSGMLLGFILALICDTITAATLLGTSFYFLCLFCSGTLWPVEGAYPYLRLFCWIMPMTLPNEALRHVTLRGWTLGDKSAQLALISSWLWSLAFLVILLSIIRVKR